MKVLIFHNGFLFFISHCLRDAYPGFSRAQAAGKNYPHQKCKGGVHRAGLQRAMYFEAVPRQCAGRPAFFLQDAQTARRSSSFWKRALAAAIRSWTETEPDDDSFSSVPFLASALRGKLLLRLGGRVVDDKALVGAAAHRTLFRLQGVTLKVSLRPSTATSSLWQVTVIPTGVGAVCSSSSLVPTVPLPASSAGATLCPYESSRSFSASATSAGVANTSSVPSPMVLR